ncbi:esterase [Granulicella sp. dw_53]|uniref:alpha/beta hydrolase n=1 Tax=Granulicella sp. dw_53 TaxID=2719792 RepID=UPI001BD628D5|nr:esterase [Granulicella sp. dw_53]
MRHSFAVSLITVFLCLSLQAQTSIDSHQVNPDHTITFRYQDPNAKKVVVAFDGLPKPLPMAQDATGLWTATTPPLAPQIYAYRIDVEDRPHFDPWNFNITPNLFYQGAEVEVPADTPMPWDIAAVPHGAVNHHTYNTRVVVGLPANQGSYYVYTPPGYSANAKKPYPVLYLLHGWSQTAAAWTAINQADIIFDNLIAQGKMKPMIVVMPLGYGDISFAKSFKVWNDTAIIDRNTQLFSQTLLTEVLPQVESTYNVSRKREDRAIAGLSMGGLESLTIGLANTDKFAWVLGLSSAIQRLDFATTMATLDPKAANLRLLWVSCGTEDDLITPNRKFVAFLKTKNMPVTPIETPGRHTALVWRENLTQFAPLLFQPATH